MRPLPNQDRPTAQDVKDLRSRVRWTQDEAARWCRVKLRAFQNYEAGSPVMPAPVWALFRLEAENELRYQDAHGYDPEAARRFVQLVDELGEEGDD